MGVPVHESATTATAHDYSTGESEHSFYSPSPSERSSEDGFLDDLIPDFPPPTYREATSLSPFNGEPRSASSASSPAYSNIDPLASSSHAKRPSLFRRGKAKLSSQKDTLAKAARKSDWARVSIMVEEEKTRGSVGQETINEAFLCSVADADETTLKLLLSNGANINAKDPHGCGALFYAVEDSRQPSPAQVSRLQLLIAAGANVDERNFNGETVLIAAIRREKAALVKALLVAHADPELTDMRGRTPLLRAAERGNQEICDTLLEYGANFGEVCARERTALLCAADKSLYGIAESLLKSGADANAKDDKARSALHKAVVNLAPHSATTKFIEVLVRWGAELNAKDRDGNTPLHLAVELGKYHLVKALLDQRAAINARTRDNKTVVDIASRQSKSAIFALLRESGGLYYCELNTRQST